MQHQTFRKKGVSSRAAKDFLRLALFVCLFFCTAQKNNSAVVNSDYKKACEALERLRWDQAVSPMAILCPIVRIVNVVMLSSAVFFVIFIFMASIKYSLSQGDPKALEASKQTLINSVLGFLLIVGSWTILRIIVNILGLNAAVLNPVEMLARNLAKLFETFNIHAP